MEADLGRRAPSEARLQLARRPLMIGVASSQAFLAASASLNVTYKDQNKNPKPPIKKKKKHQPQNPLQQDPKWFRKYLQIHILWIYQ